MESGVPFQLKVDHESGQVASRGLEDFDGALSTGTCGHPKICPFTGELHTFLSRYAPPAASCSFQLRPLAAELHG